MIVCGVDGSDVSLAALHDSAELAERLGGSVVLAHVADAASDRLSDDVVQQARAAVSRVPVKVESVRGRPADELLALARRERAALLAVGSRGRGAITTLVLGSVCNELAQKADLPIMVVSPTAAEHLPSVSVPASA